MPTSVLHYTLVVAIILTVSVLFSAFVNMERRTKIAYLVIVLGFLAFLTMFHSADVGHDTAMYLNRFIAIRDTGDIVSYIKDSPMEPGFILYTYLLSKVSSNPQILFIASGIIIYFSLGRIIYRHCKAPGLVIFCIVTMQFFDMYLSGLRQALALAILLFSDRYILEKKFLPFLLVVLGATCFHYTAILFLIAYPIATIKLKKDSGHASLRIIGGLAGIAAIYFGFEYLLEIAFTLFPKYRYYIGSSVLVSELNLAIFLRTAVYLLMLLVPRLLLGKRELVENPDSNEAIYRFTISNIVLSAIAMNASVLTRLGVYFAPFAIIYYSNSIQRLEKSTSVIAVLVSIVFLYIYGLIIVIYRMPAWYSTYPYSFCF